MEVSKHVGSPGQKFWSLDDEDVWMRLLSPAQQVRAVRGNEDLEEFLVRFLLLAFQDDGPLTLTSRSNSNNQQNSTSLPIMSLYWISHAHAERKREE